jgi:hypothetical protein
VKIAALSRTEGSIHLVRGADNRGTAPAFPFGERGRCRVGKRRRFDDTGLDLIGNVSETVDLALAEVHDNARTTDR